MPAVISDPVERLLLDEARVAKPSFRRPAALDVSPATARTLGELAGSGCRVWVDSCRAEAEFSAVEGVVGIEVLPRYDDALLADADLVIMRLPRSLDALAERVATIARHAATDVTVLAGGRVKYLNRGMNDVLGRRFASVRASLGRQKSRVLIARSPLADTPDTEPASRRHDDLGLTVVAHGGAFAGTSVDLGTRALLDELAMPATAVRAADLGCGTGILATASALRHPQLRVTAVDDSAVACWSAEATARTNGVADRVDVHRADLLTGVPDGTLDLVVCNPPFHRGPAKDSGDAFRMITEAARVLRPDGELWLVFNAHLPYLPSLRQVVGPTEIVRRTPGYLVTRSRRAAAR